MGVNGVELKVGQVWKDREGREVRIERTRNDSLDHLGSSDMFPFLGTNDESYTPAGTVWNNSESVLDLIELVQDENGWRPWKAEASNKRPVDGDTLVRYRLEDGREFEGKAGSMLWGKMEGKPDIVAYKIIEESTDLEGVSKLIPPSESAAIYALQAAESHLRDRAATYDAPGGERSMGKAVSAFNAIRDRDLTEAEGWLLIQLLKDVRLFSAPGYHADSAEDCIAYAALKAEAKAGEVA